MVKVVERSVIMGTGQQIEHLQQADVAAQLSCLASNVASLCHALSRGAAPGRLGLLIERTRGFLALASKLDAGNPKGVSYSELIPFQVWRDVSDMCLGESSQRVEKILSAVDQGQPEPFTFTVEATYFRELAEKLSDRGMSSIKTAQDPLRV